MPLAMWKSGAMKVSQRPTERDLAPQTAARTTALTARARRGGGAGTREVPLLLNRYRLERRLGSGGFGTVWMARDERLEREVAVKVLPRERVVGGRFEREARAAARLSHPGIVTLYEAAVDDEGAYLVSELVRGQTFDRLLEAGRLSDRAIVEVGAALCDALAHAHGQSVVHRDVKPSNILIPERPETALQVAKLTDFGVARVIGGDTLTRTGDIVGTAAYMAPEQAEGREAGAAADLYSLALVLYEALTGLNPVRALAGGQHPRRLAAHLPPVRRYRRDLPRDLARGIDLALRPRPRERGTLEELRGALRASLDLVQDNPGVVGGPWRSRSDRSYGTSRGVRERRDRHADPGREWSPAPADRHEPEAPGEQPAPGTRVGRPARAISALAAALVTAWLTTAVSAHPALPAPAAGLLAALAVTALPRLGWLIVAAAGAGSLLVAGHGGAALVVVIGALVPILLLPRQPCRWPLAGLAPVLGAVGLAGAWPALAARAPRAWQRAALAITGWVWLLLAGPLVGTGLYAHIAAGTPARTVWSSSLYETIHHVLPRALASGRLLPALVWAIGAAVLPSVANGSSLTVRGLRTGIWSVTLVLSTLLLLAIAGIHPAVSIGAALLGMLAAWLVALAPGAGAASRVPVGAGRRPGLA